MKKEIIVEEYLTELENAIIEAKSANDTKAYFRLSKIVQQEMANIFHYYGINRLAVPFNLTTQWPFAKFMFFWLSKPEDMGDHDDCLFDYIESNGYRGSKDGIGYIASPETIRWILRTIDLNKKRNIPIEKWCYGHKLI